MVSGLSASQLMALYRPTNLSGMNERAASFLAGVLGDDGARAFKKAMDGEHSLAAAVVPRAIVSWIDLATKFSYRGNIPGVENTFVEFRKSERGFNGAISIGSDIYNFSNATPYHLAASVAVALGVDETGLTTKTRDATLQRLGKSIDTLVKSRVAVAALERRKLQKGIAPGLEVKKSGDNTIKTHNYNHVLSPEHREAGYQLHVHHTPKQGALKASLTHRDPVMGLSEVGHIKASHDGQNLTVTDTDMKPEHMGKGLGASMHEAMMAHGFHSGARQLVGPETTMKTEQPGASAKPTAQQAALEPAAPSFQTAQPRPPAKAQTAKISKSESGVKCPTCRRLQFQDGQFVGCFCFRDLAKAVSILKADAGGYTLRFDAEWDADAILALRESMRE
jgi:hypothetical protein